MNDTFLIDRIDFVNIFKKALRQPRRTTRVLYVTGPEKMGKTRLLREYKRLAEDDFHAHGALINLRTQSQTKDPEDILFAIAQQIGLSYFQHYEEYKQKLVTSSKVEVKNTFQFLSNLIAKVDSEENNKNILKHQRQNLTGNLIKDLRLVPHNTKIVLLFDAFDDADTSVQTWLMDDLFLALSQIHNILTVVAGRKIQEAPDSWSDSCNVCALPPVEFKDHKQYCEKAGIDLPDETIRAFHSAFEGKPGLFVEFTKMWVTNK